MIKLNQLLRQGKTFMATFIAAAGSFVIGIALPIDFPLNNLVRILDIVKVQKQTIKPTVTPTATPTLLKVNIKLKAGVENKQNQSLLKLDDNQPNLAIPSRFQGATVNRVKLPSQQKAIALTFDDGPWPESTVEILNILNKNQIKATFFMVGRYLKVYPDIAKKVAANGHAIGNHTWNHRYYQYNQAAAAKEIDRTTALIKEVTGMNVSMFRPPGGILTNGLAAYARKKKYTVVMWSVDSLDWRNSMQSLKQNVLRQTNSGGIILMHDGGGNRSNTVTALPSIIITLKKQGYKFVTVPELLQIQEKEMKNNHKNHQLVQNVN
ncbi:polysaccharide deacetylase [Oscillatoriales cyanobacterium USR001]|nr:polysaccharide deacetylase [Oscillatoriales cyanobacterium USR001]